MPQIKTIVHIQTITNCHNKSNQFSLFIFTLDFKSICMIMKTCEDYRLRRLTFHALRYVVQYLQLHSVLH